MTMNLMQVYRGETRIDGVYPNGNYRHNLDADWYYHCPQDVCWFAYDEDIKEICVACPHVYGQRLYYQAKRGMRFKNSREYLEMCVREHIGIR